MATQALYRKWRPRTFAEVVGQHHVTRTLHNALATERIAHAYLFTGPRGTGKTTTARLLAKAVNCLGEGESVPCGVCRICRAVEEGRLLDMIEIDAASNRGIDEIRDLREKVGFRPGEARVKFYIIDEVHMLTDPAFNALLKTLEEPPPHVIFVLATTEPHKVPATIISRCQRFDFRRIPLAEISGWLAHIAEVEGLKVEPAALEYIARQGGGSMRDAISLLDQLTAYSSETITLPQVQDVLGATASQAVIDLADSMIDGDLARGLDVINQVVGDGAEPKQFTRDFVEYLRGLLLLKMGDGASLLRASVSEETLARMQEQVNRLSPRTLLRATRLFNAAASEMKTGFLPQLPLELAFVETIVDDAGSEPPPSAPRSPAAVPATEGSAPVSPGPPTPRGGSAAGAGGIGKGRPEPVRPASAAAQPATAQSASPPPSVKEAPSAQESPRAAAPPQTAVPSAAQPKTEAVSFPLVEDNWRAILTQLNQTSRMTAALLRSPGVLPVGVEGRQVIIEVPAEWPEELKRRIEKPNHRSAVEQCIGQVVGAPVALRFVTKGEYRPGRPPSPVTPGEEAGPPSPALAPGGSAEAGGASDSDQDPMIREALDLGAEIKNVE